MAFLPLAGTIVVGNTVAGRIAGSMTLRRLLSTAFLTGASGLLALALAVGGDGGYALGILPGLLPSGFGQGMAFTGMFITGTRDLPPESNGTGSALVTTAQYTGGAVGLALMVLLHGEHPASADFVLTFCVTAAIAIAAVPLALSLLAPTGRASSPCPRTTSLPSTRPVVINEHRSVGHVCGRRKADGAESASAGACDADDRALRSWQSAASACDPADDRALVPLAGAMRTLG